MRHIPKPQNSPARQLLVTERQSLRASGLAETYDNFNPKKQLNDYLRAEQQCICCYCQKHIDHHNNPNEGGSHNEHFYPERGPHAYPHLQLAYDNLFACCNATKDSEEALKHCGWSKHDTLLLTNFLLDPKCSSYFKYNTDGEITPVGPYRKYCDFHQNRQLLTPMQRELTDAIDVLKLNIDSLTLFRRQVIADVQKSMLNCTKQQLLHRISILNHPLDGVLAPMVDLVLFILKQRISNMG